MNETANQDGIGQAWSDVRGEELAAVDGGALDFHLDLQRINVLPGESWTINLGE
jgi:hypothetical protein